VRRAQQSHSIRPSTSPQSDTYEEQVDELVLIDGAATVLSSSDLQATDLATSASGLTGLTTTNGVDGDSATTSTHQSAVPRLSARQHFSLILLLSTPAWLSSYSPPLFHSMGLMGVVEKRR
jgi:hypothetical protein